MSTRSAIIAKIGDFYYGIYCHFDGYVDGVGKVLHQHYQDAEKVKRLIELGDISSLGERIDPIGNHSFDAREKGTTCAYHRDRGDAKITARRSPFNWKNVAREIGHNGYVYVFEHDAGWCVNLKFDKKSGWKSSNLADHFKQLAD